MTSVRFALRVLAAAGLAAALTASAAQADGPFAAFAGAYRGQGTIYDINGKSETLTCKSTNAPAPDGIAMNMSLVCASDSYRVDFSVDLFTDGRALHGTWSEKTRQTNGNLTGTIDPDTINVNATAPTFDAAIAVHVTKGGRLDITMNSHGTSITKVSVSMKK